MLERKNRKYISVKTNDRYIKKEYKIRENKNIWLLMKEFINIHVQTGELFTRATMLEYIYPDIANSIKNIINTADTYRCLLCNENIPILEATKKLGTYKKLQDIPMNLTTTKLKEIVTEKSWKSWFVPFENKLN